MLMINACGAPLNGSKLVYLAGPITGTSYGECNDWRDYAASRFADRPDNLIAVISPLREKHYLKDEKRFRQATRITCSPTHGRHDVRRVRRVPRCCSARQLRGRKVGFHRIVPRNRSRESAQQANGRGDTCSWVRRVRESPPTPDARGVRQHLRDDA
jgi:hypothetical protein